MIIKDEGEKGKETVLEKDRTDIELISSSEGVLDVEMINTEVIEEMTADKIETKMIVGIQSEYQNLTQGTAVEMMKIKDEHHENKSSVEENTQMEVVEEVVESVGAVNEMKPDLSTVTGCARDVEDVIVADERTQVPDRDGDVDVDHEISIGQIVEIEGEIKGKATGNISTVVGVSEGLGRLISHDYTFQLSCTIRYS